MRRWSVQLFIPAALIFFTTAVGAQTLEQKPGQAVSPYYSADEYRLAHSMFDDLKRDLNGAQADAGINLAINQRFDTARTDLNALEQSWDNGHYDSRQILKTISAIQMVLNESLPYDSEALARDQSRLLDFRSEYY